MQILPIIIPFVRITSNLALSCGALYNWLSNNSFPIRTSKDYFSLDNLSLYKLLEYPNFDFWSLFELLHVINRSYCDHLLLLLQKGINIEAKNGSGWTPLMYAAWWGKTECLRLLLRHKANIEARDKFGETPLICAAEKGKTDCLKLLLEHGAQVDPETKEKYPQYSDLW